MGNNHKTAIVIFSTAFFYRLLIFITLAWWSGQTGFDFPKFGSDANSYWHLALDISETGSYATNDRATGLLRAPGYPAYIAFFQTLLGTSLVAQYAAVFVQIALIGFAAVLLYRLMTRIVSERTARFAALFFALEPNSAYYSTLLLSDALFVFLFIAATYILLTHTSYRAFFSTGFALGAAMLIRPIAQFFPAVVILYFFITRGIRRTTIVASAAFLIGTLVLPFPWMIHNHAMLGTFSLSSSGPNTYYKYVMPQFTAWRTGRPQADVQEEFNTALTNVTADGKNPTTFMQNEITRIVTGHMPLYAVYHTIKTIPFFLGDGIREILQKTELLDEKQPNITTLLLQKEFTDITRVIFWHPYLLIAVAGGLFWSSVLALAGVGFWQAFRAGGAPRTYVLYFAMIILYIALLTGAATSTRHRMPALPFIAALMAIGISYIKTRYSYFSFAHKYEVVRNIFRRENF